MIKTKSPLRKLFSKANVPAVLPLATPPSGARSTGLDLFLAPLLPVLPPPPKVEPVQAVKLPRPRLVFGVDATGSRCRAWNTARQITDGLFTALPDELDVALAVHGGSKLHTFTPFTASAGALRDIASAVECRAGGTCFLDILRRVLATDGVRVVIYIGDVFEESEAEARRLATALSLHLTRVIILHDACGWETDPPRIFSEIAARTDGAVLPFNTAAVDQLRELLGAVAMLAVGGTEMLTAKQETLPAARLLLQHLKGTKA